MPFACVIVSVPPVNESGPEKLVLCTVPFAETLRSALLTFEMTRSDVDAIPVESDVVVAPDATIFPKVLVPVKVLFVNVFGIVVEEPT